MKQAYRRKHLVPDFAQNQQSIIFFFFNDPAPTEFHPLPLHDALPIWGELSLLPGQRMYVSVRPADPGEVLQAPHDDSRLLIATDPELSDTTLKDFIARRSLMVSAPQS